MARKQAALSRPSTGRFPVPLECLPDAAVFPDPVSSPSELRAWQPQHCLREPAIFSSADLVRTFEFVAAQIVNKAAPDDFRRRPGHGLKVLREKCEASQRIVDEAARSRRGYDGSIVSGKSIPMRFDLRSRERSTPEPARSVASQSRMVLSAWPVASVRPLGEKASARMGDGSSPRPGDTLTPPISCQVAVSQNWTALPLATANKRSSGEKGAMSGSRQLQVE